MKYTVEQINEIARKSAEQFIQMYGEKLSEENREQLKQEIIGIERRCLEDEGNILAEPGIFSQDADDKMLKRLNQSGYEAHKAALKYGIDTGFGKIMKRLTM